MFDIKVDNPKSAYIPGESGCDICKLYKTCNKPKMNVSGKGKRKILFVAEAPGSEEDKLGMHFVGKSGRLLRNVLRELGYNLDEDCFNTNAVNCRPPQKREPDKKEINACRFRVWQQIESCKPKVVIPLGGIANECILYHYWKKDIGKSTLWRGLHIPTRDGFWICPTIHPSYVLHSLQKGGEHHNPAVRTIFKQDIKNATDHCLKRPFVPFLEPKIHVLYNEKDIIDCIRSIRKTNKPTAVDYETTGLKLESEGHTIYSCALCNDTRRAYSFKISEQNIGRVLSEFIYSDCPKIAQNMQYEERCTRAVWERGNNWIHDTMLASHVEDNRKKYTGLKFQAFIKYGIPDYSSSIKDFFGTEEKGGNEMNNIEKAPIDDLLLYGGMDVLLTFMLWKDQTKIMK